MKAIILVLIIGVTGTFILEGQRDTILIDFGSAQLTSPAPWNNMTSPDDDQIDRLITSHGITSNFACRVFDSFNGVNSAGTQMPNPRFWLIPTSSGDSFFGNTEEFNGQVEATGGIELSGLHPNEIYTISIFFITNCF